MIKHQDIIQADATIIAGLLILLAVQSTGSYSSLTDTMIKYRTIDSEINSTTLLIKADYDKSLTALRIYEKDPNDLEKKFAFDDADKNYENDKALMYQILPKQSEITAELATYNSIPQEKLPFVTPQYLIVILISPFFLSLFCEISDYSIRKTENATIMGSSLLWIGVFVLIACITISATIPGDISHAFFSQFGKNLHS